MEQATDNHHPSPLRARIRPWLWLVALVVALVYLGWLGRTLLDAQNQSVDWLPATEPCDLRKGACSVSRGERQILFAIDSATIHSSQPIALRVELKGFSSNKVEVELQGRDMFMGMNSFPLQRQQDGSYRGEGRLPVCTTEAMVWRASIRVSEGQNLIGGHFDFEAK